MTTDRIFINLDQDAIREARIANDFNDPRWMEIERLYPQLVGTKWVEANGFAQIVIEGDEQMTKLTKNQQRALESLKDSRVYVGNCSPDVMRSYEALVRKGLAEVISENATGKRYAAVVQ